MKPKVVITLEDFNYDFKDVIDYFGEKGYYAEWRPKAFGDSKSSEEVIERAKGFDAVLAAGDSFNKEVLEAISDKVKIIARFGIGYDKVDIETATRLGIAVTNTPGKMSTPVAETAFLMMLALGRKLCETNDKTKAGKWFKSYTGTQLEGKTVGLIGFGMISQKVVTYLKGFSCKVLAYDKYFNEKAAKDLSVEYATVDEIASQADYISLHVPMTDETKGMIDKEFFKKMKPTAYLINTSRGGVVNEADLIWALKENRIAGAGLDVFEKEPADPENPLFRMDNVIVTPHHAGITKETIWDTCMCAAENIFAAVEGKTPPNILNPEYLRNLQKA